MSNRKEEVDREKVCPFLIRLFYKENDSHTVEQFQNKFEELTKNEICLYTWKDGNLREIVDLVKTGLDLATKKDVRFRFWIVYQDSRGNMKKREIGTIHSTKKFKEDFITLFEHKFRIGDFLDLSIISN